MRTIKSYVRRQGRMTQAQQFALLDENRSLLMLKLDEVANFVSNTEPGIVLDIGFGMGESLISLAKDNPDQQIIGVEVYRPGIGSAMVKIRQQGLLNIKIIEADVLAVLSQLGQHTIDGVQILFPDPWPKKKHQKRRLIQADLLEQIKHILGTKGWVHIVTDHSGYASHIKACLDLALFDLLDINLCQEKPMLSLATKYHARAKRCNHKISSFFCHTPGDE